MNNLIDQIFDNLDSWRHFPSYQLERRADIFFSIYLRGFLEEIKKYDVRTIIPEFPIRVGSVYAKSDINKSFKVDYLVKLENPNKVLFVELKTDDSSRRPKQDWYLTEAKNKGMFSLLEGLTHIYAATTSKNKYKHLLLALESANLIRLSKEDKIEIVEGNLDISIIYLQPCSTNDSDVICFDDFADYIYKKSDYLSQRFAKSLKEWARKKAGANGT